MSAIAGIEVEGLSATIKVLGKVDKGLRKEAGKVVREYAVRIKSEAWAKYQTSPGVRRSGYKLTKGAVSHRATATKASVGINRQSKVGRNAAVFAAEFGAYTATVPRYDGPGVKGRFRVYGQNDMRRRTFPVWRGNQTTIRGKSGPGWVIMPILRKRVPQIEKDLNRDLMVVMQGSMRKAGVKRG